MKKLLESLLAVSMMFQVAIIPTMAQEEEPIDDSAIVEETEETTETEEVSEIEDEIADEEIIDEETEVVEINDEQEEVTEEETQAYEYWKKESNGKWRYYLKDGSYVKNYEYRCSDRNYYYFDGNGYMVTGWVYVKENQNDGEIAEWRYYDSASVSGWKQINGAWYYFLPSDACSYPNDYEGNVMFHSTVLIQGLGYWFDDSGRWMEKGWYSIGDTWYYFDAPHKAHDGWLKYGNDWYYIWDGFMCRETRHKIGNSYYYFDKNGHYVKNSWVKIHDYSLENEGDYWHYYGSDGKEVSGWKKINNKWYYFNPNEANAMASSTLLIINGKKYPFDENGVWVEKGWFKDNYNNWWYYYDGTDTPHTGWIKDGNYWYFTDENGAMLCSQMLAYKGAYYYVDDNGRMVTNQKIYYNGQYHTFGADGKEIK